MENNALIPYMRKSSGEDPALSLARQRGAIQRWAEANGVTLAPQVWEPGVSGSKHWRERALGKAVAAVERGEAAGIVVEELSRLTRGNQLHVAELWDALQRADARLVITAEGLDTSHGDQELNFGLRALLARDQWKQYARRMADVKERKLRDGYPLGPVPFGYRRDRDRRVVLDPALTPIIREVYERRAQGEGSERLARFLDERAPRAKGKAWSRQAVAFMLANPIYYTGHLHHGDLVSEWDSGAHVDAPLWHAVQRAPAPPRPRSNDWLLTGLATCGTCGHRLEPHTSRPDGPQSKAYRYLRCMNRSCDARRGASVRWLDHVVVSLTFQRTAELETQAVEAAPDLKPLEDALARAEARLEQVLAPEARDALGDLWAADVKARRLERDAAAAALGQARQASPVEPATMRLAEVWDGLSVEDRRAALGLFWQEIRVGAKVGRTRQLTLVPRGPGAVAEVALGEAVA
jgi:DNA invertase Pin-like site-specific DNA recombinase